MSHACNVMHVWTTLFCATFYTATITIRTKQQMI